MTALSKMIHTLFKVLQNPRNHPATLCRSQESWVSLLKQLAPTAWPLGPKVTIRPVSAWVNGDFCHWHWGPGQIVVNYRGDKQNFSFSMNSSQTPSQTGAKPQHQYPSFRPAILLWLFLCIVIKNCEQILTAHCRARISAPTALTLQVRGGGTRGKQELGEPFTVNRQTEDPSP